MSEVPVGEPEIVVEKDVMVAMRDGVRLRTDVYRPAGSGPLPTLVTRYPYVCDERVEAGNLVVARQGYAVVWQHCRGRYGSEGDFYPVRPDIEDGYDTVEWAAAQPWSNGRVGMFGASYGGMQQYAAAIARPPHLVAIAPTSAAWSFVGGTNVWYWARDVLGLGMALMWTGQMTTWEAEKRGVPTTLPAFVEIERAMRELATNPDSFAKASHMLATLLADLLGRRPLRGIEELAELAPWWRDWCDHGDPRDPYWTQVSASEHIEALELPILHTTGWYDFVTQGVLDGYRTMKSSGPTEAVRKAQRLVVGPWSHTPGVVPRPDVPTGPEHLDLYSSHEGSPVMEFFRHHLKGEDTGLADEPPVRIFVMGDNVWRDEWEWPLARTEWTSYHLHSGGGANTLDGDGTLTTEPSADEPADTFVYDPADPVPGPTAVGLTAGPEIDPRTTGLRGDVLVYTTAVLDRDIEVTGPVTLELWASSSVADTDFTAKLLDVFPDGQVLPICQGLVRTRNTDAHPMTPEGIHRFAIELWSTSNVFKAGHRIRLHVSSSEFPTYELNPNTGGRITHDETGRTVPATQRVHHDSAHPSRLVLPVIPS